ncbi:MAG: CvpA family protein [Defluviitaleaceae bacterium]|nr:CvpA family protein [Defluviitaleaceae bacterium]
MLDIVTVLIIILNIAIGVKRGFINTVLGIAIFVLAVFFTRALHGHLAAFLVTTPLYDTVFEWVVQQLALEDIAGDVVHGAAADIQAQIVQNMPMAGLLVGLIDIEIIQIGNFVNISAIEMQIGGMITDAIINIVSALILFFFFVFGFRIIASVINLIAMLPIIRGVNRNLGASLGAFMGIVTVWLLLIIFNLTMVRQGNIFEYHLYASTITLWLNERNFLFSLLINLAPF